MPDRLWRVTAECRKDVDAQIRLGFTNREGEGDATGRFGSVPTLRVFEGVVNQGHW